MRELALRVLPGDLVEIVSPNGIKTSQMLMSLHGKTFFSNEGDLSTVITRSVDTNVITLLHHRTRNVYCHTHFCYKVVK